MKPKMKCCRNCNREFMPFKTTQTACSISCAMKIAKIKEEQQKQDDKETVNRWIQEDKEEKSLERLKETTRKAVHQFIRIRDQYKPCVSCLKPWSDNFHAGHYHKAELYSALKYDFFNINGQCPECNIHKDGNLEHYNIHLPTRIGKIEFDKLNERAAGAKKKGIHSWERDALKEIRNTANKLTKQLKTNF